MHTLTDGYVIASILLIILFITLLFIIFLFIGFYMGTKTQGKDIEIFQPDKTGGQPLFEEDPYADAMRESKEFTKGEGSL